MYVYINVICVCERRREGRREGGGREGGTERERERDRDRERCAHVFHLIWFVVQ